VRVSASRFHDENFLIRKLHPGKVIDIVIAFALGVDIRPGVVMEVELLFVEVHTGKLLLTGVFAHEFEQDGAVSMENFVDLTNDFGRGTAETDVIVVFADVGAKNFVRSSDDGRFTDGAGAGHGERIGGREEYGLVVRGEEKMGK
jgi:hypothetical protein